MIFKTSLDKLAKGTTIAITVLFASIIISQLFIFKNTYQNSLYLLPSALILIYFITFGLRPINYHLTADELVIHRLFSDVKINRNQIKSVELLDKNSIRLAIRTFGVGGLFGYYGKFANTKLGSMTWYATRRDRTVLVETIENKKIVLTPDDPEKFVDSFNKPQ
ncbi:MAG TPA: PH domain-containing protein [Edaphocola sp.]|nr:PH domain-containing protein [Edaphocola sp.]